LTFCCVSLSRCHRQLCLSLLILVAYCELATAGLESNQRLDRHVSWCGCECGANRCDDEAWLAGARKRRARECRGPCAKHRNNSFAGPALAHRPPSRTGQANIRLLGRTIQLPGLLTTTAIRNGGQQRGTEAPEGEQVLPVRGRRRPEEGMSRRRADAPRRRRRRHCGCMSAVTAATAHGRCALHRQNSADCASRLARLSALRNPGPRSNLAPLSSSSLAVSVASASSCSSTCPRVSSSSPVPSKSTAFLCDG
jgi:hypothetical protein